MEDYSYIIEEVCTTEKSEQLVRKIIPILVSWAKKKETHHTYKDLNINLGYEDGLYSGIGYPLGRVQDVILRLREETNEEIPVLNALVNSKDQKLPSHGFMYIYPNYEDMDINTKHAVVSYENNRAINYNNWDWVLASLGLKPILNVKDERDIRNGLFGFGGEGPEHKKMKEFIASHPKSIGLMNCENGITEHILLSGDRLDVYFPNKNIAVEVKPKSSPDSDILRGLFQCVKYKSILNAESEVKGEKIDSEALLVIEGKLSPSNKNVQKCLNINVIENFKFR